MPETTSDSDLQNALSEVIFAYNKAVDAGTSPDRDSLLRSHPELADELRAFFADQDHCRNIRPMLGDSTPTLAHARVPITDRPDRQFGPYELIEEIARGGMGVIYRAHHAPLQRIVALKMIADGRLATREDLLRFRAEAEAVAQLDHPNIVPIYEVGEIDGRPFFTMRLIEGGSLARLIASGDWPTGRKGLHDTARLIAAIARAVHFAHQHGILHRDLKPGNILLQAHGSSSGSLSPFVTDFGLAKKIEGESDLTQSGAIVGTPAYMAPEQATPGGTITTASDVYSLGAILFELIAGKKPFVGETPLATLLQVQTIEPTKPSALRPHIDTDLETICLKCLEKEPRRRYPSAEALADDLDRYLAGEPIQARPITRWARLLKWVRKHPAVAGLSVLLALTVCTALVLVSWKWLESEDARLRAESAQRDAENARAQAEEERNKAREKAEEAIEHRRRAEKEKQNAEDRLRQLRAMDIVSDSLKGNVVRSLYLSRLARMEAAYQQGRLDRVQHFLQTEKVGTSWEWDFFRRLGLQGRTVPLDIRPIITASLSPSLRNIALTQEDGPLTLVEIEDEGSSVNAIRGEMGDLTRIAWQPDTRRFAVAAADGTVRLWDRVRGVELHAWREFKRPVQALTFSPDGKSLLAGCEDDGVRVWDVATHDLVANLPHEKAVTALAAGEHSIVATASADGVIRIWNSATGKVDRTINTNHAPILSMQMLPDASVVAWGTENGIVEIGHKAPHQKRLHWRAFVRGPEAIALHPAGKIIALAQEHSLELRDTESGNLIGHWPARPLSVRFSADGRQVSWLGLDRTWQIREMARHSPARTFSLGKSAVLGVATCKGTVAAVGLEGARLLEYDTAKELWFRAVPSTCVAYARNGKWLAVGAPDASVTLLDAATGKPQKTLEGEKHAVTSVEIAPDQQTIVAGYADGTVRLWKRTGEIVHVWRDHAGPVLSTALDADGTRVFSCSRNKWITRHAETGKVQSQLLDGDLRAGSILTNGEVIVGTNTQRIEIGEKSNDPRVKKSFRSHHLAQPIEGLALSVDSGLIVVQLAGEILLFDLELGREVLTLPGTTGRCRALAFRDGLVVAGCDNVVVVWDGRTD